LILDKQFAKDKKMKKIQKNGETDAVLEMRKKVKELTVNYDRLDKVEKQLEFQNKTKDEQNNNFEETKQKLEQIERRANGKGIYIDNLNEEGDSDSGYSISNDPLMYKRKEKILNQAIETDRAMYAKTLEHLKTKLIQTLKEKNEIVEGLKDRQEKTIEIRKDVNELMIKSRLMSEKDAEIALQDSKNSITKFPEESSIKEDKIMNKLNSIIRSSKKKSKANKIHNGNKGSEEVNFRN